MKPIRRGATLALVAASMAGGAVGATVISAASSNAATTNTTSTTSTTPQGGMPGGGPGGHDGVGPRGAQDGKFHSNENPAHEKTESAQREAQETAGQFPTVK
jgi:hypothetical protein